LSQQETSYTVCTVQGGLKTEPRIFTLIMSIALTMQENSGFTDL